jgi:hypothetical protein
VTLQRLWALAQALVDARDQALTLPPDVDTYLQPLPLVYGCDHRPRYYTAAATPNYDHLKGLRP